MSDSLDLAVQVRPGFIVPLLISLVFQTKLELEPG